MSEKFEVGEVAIAVNWKFKAAVWNGTEVLIVGELAERFRRGYTNGRETLGICYTVRTQDGAIFAPDPWLLKKKPPAREDHQLVKWSECPWQPSRERA